MKKKGLALLAIFTCVAAMCFALVACGGNNKANFVGDWTLESMQDSTMTLTASDLASYGLEMTMTLKEDGSGSFNMMGESMNFSWEAKSATEISVKDAETVASTFTLADDKLSAENNGAKMVFKRKS